MIEIEFYRVQMVNGPKGRRPRHWWSRTHQAEWLGCERAPRAWTRNGIERKACRWVTR